MCASAVAPVRVLVADQHRIVRAGIRVLLMETRSWQPFEVDEAETTEEAIALLTSAQYRVVLMEYGLPGRGGVKATEIMLARWPRVCILGLVESESVISADQMIKAGANGLILTNISADMLISAIRTVLAGRQFYSNEIALRLLERKKGLTIDSLARLTMREKEVLKAILEGFGDKEIALQMGIGRRTVDKHRQHIKGKLGVRTPLELVQAGLRLGLVSGLTRGE